MYKNAIRQRTEDIRRRMEVALPQKLLIHCLHCLNTASTAQAAYTMAYVFAYVHVLTSPKERFKNIARYELWELYAERAVDGWTDRRITPFRLLQLLARNDVRLGLTKSFPSSHICVSIQPAQSWSPAWSEKAFSGKNFQHTREARWAFTRGPEIVLHSPLVPWYCASQVGAKMNLRVK